MDSLSRIYRRGKCTGPNCTDVTDSTACAVYNLSGKLRGADLADILGDMHCHG